MQAFVLFNMDNLACGHDQYGALIPGKYSIYPYLAACGIWTTPSDLTKLLLDIMNAIKGQSKIGLTTKLVKELFLSQGCKEWTGLGVFLNGMDEKLEFSSLGWGVGFQCMLIANPHLEQGLIMMTNTDTGTHQMKGIMGETTIRMTKTEKRLSFSLFPHLIMHLHHLPIAVCID